MRLVSSYYNDHWPFDGFDWVSSTASSSKPADLEKGDVLLVWGGADIHPSLYNKKHSPQSGAWGSRPSHRDMVEWTMMQRAVELGIPIIGVCRGAQMLCALAGGYLMQHITGHAGPNHLVVTNDGQEFVVNSLHHQMMVPGKTNHTVLARSKTLLSSVYWDEEKTVDHNDEPELIIFNDVKGFAVQWHPEMMAPHCEATVYIKKALEKHLDLVRID